MKINNHGLKYEDLVIKDAEVPNYFPKFKGDLGHFKFELNDMFENIERELKK